MRRQHFSDAAVVCQQRQLWNVVLMRRPHHQPFRDEDRAIYRQTFVFRGFQFCNHGFLQR